MSIAITEVIAKLDSTPHYPTTTAEMVVGYITGYKAFLHSRVQSPHFIQVQILVLVFDLQTPKCIA